VTTSGLLPWERRAVGLPWLSLTELAPYWTVTVPFMPAS
jgi:hypothetical protein